MKSRYYIVFFAGVIAGSAIGAAYLGRFIYGPAAHSGTDAAHEEPGGGPAGAEPIEDHAIRLLAEQMERFGIETAAAGAGEIIVNISLPGEVAINADRTAHVVPRVGGVVREVRKNLGDKVRRGEVLAVIESGELADSTATLLAARERVALARSDLGREEQLWRKKISPEQDYLQAKNALAEAMIGQRAATQKLRALGFSDSGIEELADSPDSRMVWHEIVAPFDATVIEKHISLGEVVKDESETFVLADLSTVWVNLDAHQRDLPLIRIGQRAWISAGNGMPEEEGRVTFIEPTAHETARTVHARVTLPNSSGRWPPGLFVTGRIHVDRVRIT
ncbi:MAG: efflux RND transporter periplasmic adaptor subunit, partial [Acidobacteria bacterium]|nr:efflux RND transporter periplasmic adaptor subunit [Acidobacteriota bacterium]